MWCDSWVAVKAAAARSALGKGEAPAAQGRGHGEMADRVHVQVRAAQEYLHRVDELPREVLSSRLEVLPGAEAVVVFQGPSQALDDDYPQGLVRLAMGPGPCHLPDRPEPGAGLAHSGAGRGGSIRPGGPRRTRYGPGLRPKAIMALSSLGTRPSRAAICCLYLGATEGWSAGFLPLHPGTAMSDLSV